MSVRQNFNFKAQGYDATFYTENGSNIAATRQHWTTIAPYIFERSTIDPVQSGSATRAAPSVTSGDQVVFEWQRRVCADHMSGPMTLSFRMSQGTTPGTAFDAGLYGVDCLGAQMIDRVEYWCNSKLLYQVRGYQLVESYQYLSPTKRAAALVGCGGGFGDDEQSIPARQAFLQGQQGPTDAASNYFHVLLCHPWEDMDKGLFIYALPTRLEVRVYFLPTARFLACERTSAQGGSVPSVVVDKMKLSWEGVHLLDPVRANMYMTVFQKEGFSFKCTMTETEIAEFTSPTSTSSPLVYKVNNFLNSAYMHRVWAYYKGHNQPITDGGVTQYKDLKPTEYIPINTIQFLDGSLNICDVSAWKPITKLGDPSRNPNPEDWLLDSPRAFPDLLLGHKMGAVFWCHPALVQQNKDNALGTTVLKRYNCPQLYVQLPPEAGTESSALTKYSHDPSSYDVPRGLNANLNIILRIESTCHQFISLNRGDLKPLIAILS